MRSETRRQAIVAAAAIIVFFTALGGSYLWDEDEPKNAECAREMYEAGNWLVPQFNYQLRTDKPILLYWLMLASYHVFGVGEFAARFWSATLAVGTVLLTYHLGRRLYRPEVGLWAGLAMASCLMFAASGRAATPDSTLIFCTTAALYLFVRFGGVAHGTLSRGGCVAMYAAMSLAVLAKGPVGVALPGGILGLFLLCRRQQAAPVDPTASASKWPVIRSIAETLAPHRLLEVAWSLRPLTAIVVLAAVALPWYVAVHLKTDGAWLDGFWGKHNIGRFTTPMEGHGGNILYYVVAVLVGFFPWSCFLPLALYRLGRRLVSPAAAGSRAADTFIACWAGAYLTFFSLASTKLPSYVLPCYPALALATGVLIDEWLRSPALVPRRWFRAALIIPGIAGAGICIGLPIAAHFIFPGEEWLGLLGVTLVAGSGALLWAARRRTDLVPPLFATTAVVFIATAVTVGAGRISRYATSPAVAADARTTLGDEARLVAFRCFEPTLAFYAQSHVPVVHSAADLRAALARTPAACIVTRDEHLAALAEALGGPPEIIARHRRFLRTKGEVIVALPPGIAATARRDAHPTR